MQIAGAHGLLGERHPAALRDDVAEAAEQQGGKDATGVPEQSGEVVHRHEIAVGQRAWCDISGAPNGPARPLRMTVTLDRRTPNRQGALHAHGIPHFLQRLPALPRPLVIHIARARGLLRPHQRRRHHPPPSGGHGYRGHAQRVEFDAEGVSGDPVQTRGLVHPAPFQTDEALGARHQGGELDTGKRRAVAVCTVAVRPKQWCDGTFGLRAAVHLNPVRLQKCQRRGHDQRR